MTRAQAGDEAAFATLAGMVGDRLLGLAFRILRDRDRAEEATQRTLVAAWEVGGCGCATRVASSRWIRQMLANACYGELRRDRRGLVGLVRENPAQHAPDPSVDIVERDAIDRAFRRLPPDLRIILAYRFSWTCPWSASPKGSLVSPKARSSRVCIARPARYRAALEADARVPSGAESQP